MSNSKFGLVGRMVMVTVKRDPPATEEPCEVVACQTDGSGYWRILVARQDGTLLETGSERVRLIADPVGRSPYR